MPDRTYFFTTKDESMACRVLTQYSPSEPTLAFRFKDGYFEVSVAGLRPGLARNAEAIANSSLRPLPLASFRQEE